MSEVKSPWPGPKGLIPVTSGKAEDANVHNRNYLDSILVEMREVQLHVIQELINGNIWKEIFIPYHDASLLPLKQGRQGWKKTYGRVCKGS